MNVNINKKKRIRRPNNNRGFSNYIGSRQKGKAVEKKNWNIRNTSYIYIYTIERRTNQIFSKIDKLPTNANTRDSLVFSRCYSFGRQTRARSSTRG